MLSKQTPDYFKNVGLILAVILSSSLSFNASATLLKVAVIGAEQATWNTDVKNKLMATGDFSQIDIIQANATTPSLATLNTYDSVLVYSDSAFLNSAQLGNNLADYVDAGGGVVVAVFADAGAPLAITGRYASGGYLGITTTGQTAGTPLTLGTIHVAGSPIMAGVTSLSGGSSSYTSTGTLAAGAVDIADWSNGKPLVATKTVNGQTTVALNLFPVSSTMRSDFWNASTQGGLLMANALVYAANLPAASAVPEPATLGLLGLGLAGLGFSRRRNG